MKLTSTKLASVGQHMLLLYIFLPHYKDVQSYR